MDRGLLILMSLAMTLAATVIMEGMDVLSTVHVKTVMMISLGYHACYAIYTMRQWSTRSRIRNARRGNHRPPKRNPY
jgi:hypothetical protein